MSTQSSQPAAPHRLLGVGWILVASIGFSAMGLLSKLALATGRYDTWDIVFWRSIFATGLALSLMRRGRVRFAPGRLDLMVVRCAVGVVAMLLFFYSLGEIELGTATTLLYTSPLFTVLLSAPLLGERLGRATLPLAVLAFAGVILIVRPGDLGGGLEPGAFAALGAGFLAAIVYLTVRKLRATDPPSRIVFWFSASATVVCAPGALSGALPNAADFALLTGMGVSATVGQMAMTAAYRYEKASIVGPFSYATVVLSWLLGLVFLDEVLEVAALVGMTCVVVAGVGLGASAKAETPVSAGPAER